MAIKRAGEADQGRVLHVLISQSGCVGYNVHSADKTWTPNALPLFMSLIASASVQLWIWDIRYTCLHLFCNNVGFYEGLCASASVMLISCRALDKLLGQWILTFMVNDPGIDPDL